MFNIALFGAGKIGEAICGLLTETGRYKVKVCDISLERAKLVASYWKNCEPQHLNLADQTNAAELIRGCDAVISALPFFCNTQVASLAVKEKVHYFDLTEDVKTTDDISKLAKDAATCLMPQCGLAPGFISIAAAFLARSFDSLDSIKMRVGALPIYPSNQLKYNLTWSTEGLINEYGNLCEVIYNGKKQMAFPLEGYERFSMDGIEYEAFNTSGGLGTLCDSLQGKVKSLDYKSVRYPGHRELITFLMNDLRFTDDRETLKQVFERSIFATAQDKCLIFVEVKGSVKKRLLQRTYASTIYNRVVGKRHFSAIQLSTASGICTCLDLFLTEKIGQRRGFLKSEDVDLLLFLENEIGKNYKDEEALRGISA